MTAYNILNQDRGNAFDAAADWIPLRINASKLDTFIAVEPSSWSKFDDEFCHISLKM